MDSRAQRKAQRKSQWKAQWKELVRLVNDWDPCGAIRLGAPNDEYHCMIGPLLSLLARGAKKTEIVAFLNEELEHHFGEPREDTERFALTLKTHRYWRTDH